MHTTAQAVELLIEKAGSAWIQQAARPLEKSAIPGMGALGGAIGGAISHAAGPDGIPKAWNAVSTGYPGAALGGAGIGALLGSIGSLAEEDWSVRKALRSAMLGGLAGSAVGAGGKLGYDSAQNYAATAGIQKKLDAAAASKDESPEKVLKDFASSAVPVLRGYDGDYRPLYYGGYGAAGGVAAGRLIPKGHSLGRHRWGAIGGALGLGLGQAAALMPSKNQDRITTPTPEESAAYTNRWWEGGKR
jgi:hypothetical protein